MKKTKDEIWNDIKQNKSLIYGRPIFDIFIQLADLSVSHYMELNNEQKNLTNTLAILKKAVGGDDVDIIKEVLVRDAKKNPNNDHATILLRNMKDKDSAEKLLIENKKLNIYDINEIFKYSDDFQKTLSRLGEIADSFKEELKVNEQKRYIISDLLDKAKDKKEIVKFLGHELLDKLSGHQLFHFIISNGFGRPKVYLKERKERIKLLGKDLLNKVLSDVSKINFNEFIKEYDSLSNSYWKFEELIEYFGEDVIHIIDSSNIVRFLNETKNKDEFIKLIIDKNNLSPYLIKYFILKAENKNQIVEYLGKEKIKSLFRTNGLLSSTNEVEEIIKTVKDKDELATFAKYLSSEQVSGLFKNLGGNFGFKPALGLIVKHRELSREEVFRILYFAYYKIEAVDLLGEENMKKLEDEDKEKVLKVYALEQGKREVDKLKEVLGI